MRLVYLALGWSLGIALAANVALQLPLIWLTLALITGVLAWRARRIEAFAVLLFMLGGLRVAAIPLTSGIAAYNGLGGMTIDGAVVGEPDKRDDKVLVRVAVETVTRAGTTTPTDGLVLVSAPPLSDAQYGDDISATGILYEPGTSDRFSYADYLSRSGVFSVMQESAVTVTERAGNDLLSGLIGLKGQAADAIKHALPEPQASLLIGMLLGNQHGISPDVSDAFAKTGASQVIAISGFNMTVLSGVVIGLLKRLKMRRSYAAAISVGVIVAYTMFVGANPAVLRAAIMSGLLVIGTVLRRDTYLPASLAFAAMVMSLLNPLVLWDVSFQLSFFATLGIALFAKPLSARFDSVLTRWFRSGARLLSAVLTEPLVVSIAALSLALPLTMLYFGQVSPFILLVNLLIMPVQPALLLIGGVATLTAAISPVIAQVMYWIDLLPLSWTIGVVRLFATLPSYEVFVSANLISAFFVVVLGAAMIKGMQPKWTIKGVAFNWRKLALLGAVCGLGITLLSVALYISKPDGLLHVWLLDMGDSDAVLIQTPRGAHFLIDGGRYPSRLLTAIGDHLPFNNHALEVLFITQPDEAQYGALPDVIDRYDVGVVINQGQPNLAEAYKALQTKLAAHPTINARAGYSLTTDDGVRIEALNPAAQPALGDSLDRNALVLKLSYGDVSFLLTSELSTAGQQALMKLGNRIEASMLQIPQQGAIHSLDAEFVQAVAPQVAIVQGDNPDPDTLSVVGDVPLYRTDQGGTIDLSSDGHNLWITPERKS
jgi:competence protein ComEC